MFPWYRVGLFSTLLLFGCSPPRDAFAPQCPSAKLLLPLADITRYAGPAPHDVTDLILQARVVAVSGSCQAGDDPSKVPVVAKVSISLQRGPAMKGREAEVPVFVLIAEGNVVWDKKVFPLHFTFPPNVDRLTVTSPEIDMEFPVSSQKTAAAYNVIAGFQLTPDELAVNRQGGGG